MFRIGKNFHLTHVVRDLDAVDRWYDQIFAVQRYYRGYMRPAVRDASLVLIGDFVMEPVMLARVPDAEHSPIGKFLARFGERFHSMAWYVDSIPDAYATLTERHIRLYDLVGERAAPPGAGAIWTHPKDTHALLEFATVGEFTTDPRFHPGWSSRFWRDEHPLQIERTSHLTVLVNDIPTALKVYRDALGGTPLCDEQHVGERESSFLAVGEDTVIELARPLSATSAEARELKEAGEGIAAVTFQTRDLQAAAEFLRSKGQRVEATAPHTLRLDRSQTFGMTIQFTNRRIPNDPR